MKMRNKVKRLETRRKDFEEFSAKLSNPRAYKKPGSLRRS